MDLPNNMEIPFFAYGIFQRGELGYLRFRSLIDHVESSAEVSGSLWIRDGLPILELTHLNDTGRVHGSLIYFKSEASERGYKQIADIEPDKQYKWATTDATVNSDKVVSVNILAGRSPRKGSVQSDSSMWHGRDDPYFKEALSLIREEIIKESNFDLFDYRSLFRLQMAYLLLWTIIERYAALRYKLGGEPMSKIREISNDPSFAAALKKVCPNERRRVHRADRPDEFAVLDSSNPAKAIEYYYQVRSNVTHRGKAASKDFEIVQTSLKELLEIFTIVLEAAFQESRSV